MTAQCARVIRNCQKSATLLSECRALAYSRAFSRIRVVFRNLSNGGLRPVAR